MVKGSCFVLLLHSVKYFFWCYMSIKPIFFGKIDNYQLLKSDPYVDFYWFPIQSIENWSIDCNRFFTENYRLSILATKHAGVRMIPVFNGVTNRSVSLSVNATPCTSEQSERSYFQAIQITIFSWSLDRELSISKHALFEDTYPVD